MPKVIGPLLMEMKFATFAMHVRAARFIAKKMKEVDCW